MKSTPVIVGLLSLATIGPVGTYVLTRESVQEKIQDYCLSSLAELEGWKIAEDNFKKTSSSGDLVPVFKKLYDEINGNGNANGESLKKVCLDIYTWDNTSIFKSEDTKLIEQTKKYCGLKIRERLGETNIFKQEDIDSKIQAKVELLNSHDDSKGILTEKLIKLKDSQEGDKKEEFKKACEEIYDKSFLSEKSNSWILAKSYCTRN